MEAEAEVESEVEAEAEAGRLRPGGVYSAHCDWIWAPWWCRTSVSRLTLSRWETVWSCCSEPWGAIVSCSGVKSGIKRY